jgi:ABC-type lipoprotein export system ATPase subunit
VILVEKVSKIFSNGSGPTYALRDVSLKVEAGEFITIYGSSGSGKTTLLNLIGALDRPSSGRIVTGGVSLAEAHEDELARLRAQTIGFIFQAYHVEPHRSVLENVMVSLLFAGLSRGERKARSRKALASVGIAHLARQRAGDISAGERRRLTIARALVKSPRLVLADEPTANLDEGNASEIIALLRAANKEQKVTVVMVTHEKSLAAASDRVITIENGCLV